MKCIKNLGDNWPARKPGVIDGAAERRRLR